jgi:hypothetical protein
MDLGHARGHRGLLALAGRHGLLGQEGEEGPA